MVAERFIKTLKDKIYRKMTARDTNKYIDFLSKIVQEYNNTIHSTTKMKPVKVKQGSLSYAPAKNTKKPKFKTGDIVRITKYKNIFPKGHEPNWTQELFQVKKRILTTPWTYELQDSQREPVYDTFYEQELQKSRAKFPGSNS